MTKCATTISKLLQKVIVLSLDIKKYVDVGVAVGIIKAAVAEGQESKFMHLHCNVLDLFLELVQPLSSLFSFYNFQQPTLEFNNSDVYILNLIKLIHAFMLAPTQHTQTLNFVFLPSSDVFPLFPGSVSEEQLAAL